MAKNYSTFTYFLFIFILSSGVLYAQQTQDSTSQETNTSLPSKDPTVEDNGSFRSNPIKEYNKAYYIVNRLNKSIGLPPNEYNFQTPQSVLEHFVRKARNNEY